MIPSINCSQSTTYVTPNGEKNGLTLNTETSDRRSNPSCRPISPTESHIVEKVQKIKNWIEESTIIHQEDQKKIIEHLNPDIKIQEKSPLIKLLMDKWETKSRHEFSFSVVNQSYGCFCPPNEYGMHFLDGLGLIDKYTTILNEEIKNWLVNFAEAVKEYSTLTRYIVNSPFLEPLWPAFLGGPKPIEDDMSRGLLKFTLRLYLYNCIDRYDEMDLSFVEICNKDRHEQTLKELGYQTAKLITNKRLSPYKISHLVKFLLKPKYSLHVDFGCFDLPEKLAKAVLLMSSELVYCQDSVDLMTEKLLRLLNVDDDRTDGDRNAYRWLCEAGKSWVKMRFHYLEQTVLDTIIDLIDKNPLNILLLLYHVRDNLTNDRALSLLEKTQSEKQVSIETIIVNLFDSKKVNGEPVLPEEFLREWIFVFNSKNLIKRLRFDQGLFEQFCRVFQSYNSSRDRNNVYVKKALKQVFAKSIGLDKTIHFFSIVSETMAFDMLNILASDESQEVIARRLANHPTFNQNIPQQTLEYIRWTLCPTYNLSENNLCAFRSYLKTVDAPPYIAHALEFFVSKMDDDHFNNLGPEAVCSKLCKQVAVMQCMEGKLIHLKDNWSDQWFKYLRNLPLKYLIDYITSLNSEKEMFPAWDYFGVQFIDLDSQPKDSDQNFGMLSRLLLNALGRDYKDNWMKLSEKIKILRQSYLHPLESSDMMSYNGIDEIPQVKIPDNSKKIFSCWRTVYWLDDDGEAQALKFMKKSENVQDFAREAAVARTAKKIDFPAKVSCTPLGVYQIKKISEVMKQRLQTSKAWDEIHSDSDKKPYTIYHYKVHPSNFDYIDDKKVTPEVFRHKLLKMVSDSCRAIKQHIDFRILSLSHNEEYGRSYIPLMTVGEFEKDPIKKRLRDAGRQAEGYSAAQNGNARAYSDSSDAWWTDYGDIIWGEEFVNDPTKESTDLSLLNLKEKLPYFFTMNQIAKRIQSATLLTISFWKKKGELNWENKTLVEEIAETLLLVHRTVIEEFDGDPEISQLEQVINWKRRARELIFWSQPKGENGYIAYLKKKQLPEEIYPPGVKVQLPNLEEVKNWDEEDGFISGGKKDILTGKISGGNLDYGAWNGILVLLELVKEWSLTPAVAVANWMSSNKNVKLIFKG